jgi:hypothetical protein
MSPKNIEWTENAISRREAFLDQLDDFDEEEGTESVSHYLNDEDAAEFYISDSPETHPIKKPYKARCYVARGGYKFYYYYNPPKVPLIFRVEK